MNRNIDVPAPFSRTAGWWWWSCVRPEEDSD